TPNLVPVSPDQPTNQWHFEDGKAVVPKNQAAALGVMAVQLPAGSTLKTMQVVGTSNRVAGKLTVELRVLPVLAGSDTSFPIFSYEVSTKGPFGQPVTPNNPGLAVVDPAHSSYFITAHFSDGQSTDGNTLEVQGVVITFTQGG